MLHIKILINNFFFLRIYDLMVERERERLFVKKPMAHMVQIRRVKKVG